MADSVAVSVVSPVYGCQTCLTTLVDRVAEALGPRGLSFEMILVDDASPDGAWETIEELARDRDWVRGVRLSRNFGQHAAIDAGLKYARGEWVAVMDCDLQDDPGEIPALLDAAHRHGYDGVFGQRQDRQDRAAKRFSSWAFYRMMSWLTGVAQDESTANFGVFNRRLVDVVVSMPERDKAFPLMVRWAGFNIGVLPVKHAPRLEGETSYTLGKLIRLGTHIVLGYSDKPLRLVAGGGILLSLLAFLWAGFSIFSFFGGQITVAGYASVIASIWLLGGLTLFSIGVVGLYVGQIFVNVQGRPSAVVAEVVD